MHDTSRNATVRLPSLAESYCIEWDAALSKERGVYGFDSIDRRSRSFNLIRAKILELRQQRGWRMIAIVSATPHVGKSFIAANVGASISRDPRYQTYLIDFDLRRGSLTQQFGVPCETGLREYLDDCSAVGAAPAYSFADEALILLPTTAGQVHSAELLAGDRAQELLKAMRYSDERNLFIFDLPPAFANDDASTTMAALDAYILIAEDGKTTQRELHDAVALLGSERLAGVVLNKYRGGLMSEGYGVDDYYSSGYGYGGKKGS